MYRLKNYRKFARLIKIEHHMANFYTKITIIGATFALLAVALGAFGAHALKEPLIQHGSLDVWKTAVDYQMWHALALLLIASKPTTFKHAALTTWAFSVGILLFSGSLYWLSLDGPRWLGPITPLGGLSFMLGWTSLIVGQCMKKTTGLDKD